MLASLSSFVVPWFLVAVSVGDRHTCAYPPSDLPVGSFDLMSDWFILAQILK
jgi:hypothetical protein